MADDPLLTSREVAALIGVKPNTVTGWKARGRMPEPDEQYGRTPLWRRSTITDWRGRTRPRAE